MISTKTDWLRLSFITAFIFVFKNRISSTFSRVTLPLFVSLILWEAVIFCQVGFWRTFRRLPFKFRTFCGWFMTLLWWFRKFQQGSLRLTRLFMKSCHLTCITPQPFTAKKSGSPEIKVPGSPDRFYNKISSQILMAVAKIISASRICSIFVFIFLPNLAPRGAAIRLAITMTSAGR